MKNALAWAAAAALVASPAAAIEPVKPTAEPTPAAVPAVAPAAALAPAQATPAAAVSVHALPANTDVMLRMDQELNSKSVKMGDRFNMTVVNDVVSSGAVVIPAGTRGVGEVTYHTNKGAFGKSGKMEIELKHLEIGDKRVPITGKYRQEGEGNTTATIAAVVLVGVFSAFVTGKSAVIPQGRELVAQTDVPIGYDPTTLAKATILSVQPAAAPAAVPAAAPTAAPVATATPTG